MAQHTFPFVIYYFHTKFVPTKLTKCIEKTNKSTPPIYMKVFLIHARNKKQMDTIVGRKLKSGGGMVTNIFMQNQKRVEIECSCDHGVMGSFYSFEFCYSIHSIPLSFR